MQSASFRGDGMQALLDPAVVFDQYLGWLDE
jgi:hypothetical protein